MGSEVGGEQACRRRSRGRLGQLLRGLLRDLLEGRAPLTVSPQTARLLRPNPSPQLAPTRPIVTGLPAVVLSGITFQRNTG